MSELVVVREYERSLRLRLAGLPRPDVDDIVEEMRSHLRDELAEGRTPTEAAAAYGDPAEVAAEIVERRVTRDDGSRIPEASLATRAAAFVADFVLGWGPVIVFPTWVFIVGWIQDSFLIPPEEIAAMMQHYDYVRIGVPPWMLAMTLGLGAWGVYYTSVLRRRSLSVGMRMAGLSRLRVGGRPVTVRSRDVSESEPARIVARTKWYLAAPVAVLAPIVALAALYYTTMAVGSFLQPTQRSVEAVRSVEDLGRSEEVGMAFYAAVRHGDLAGARAMADPSLAATVSAMVERARIDGLDNVERGMGIDDETYEWHEYYSHARDARKQRTTILRLTRTEEERAPGVYSTVYRITGIEEAP